MTLEEKKLRELLYQAIVELQYVQEVENCPSGLCASGVGRDIIAKGMELLGMQDLSEEHLESLGDA